MIKKATGEAQTNELVDGPRNTDNKRKEMRSVKKNQLYDT